MPENNEIQTPNLIGDQAKKTWQQAEAETDPIKQNLLMKQAMAQSAAAHRAMVDKDRAETQAEAMIGEDAKALCAQALKHLGEAKCKNLLDQALERSDLNMKMYEATALNESFIVMPLWIHALDIGPVSKVILAEVFSFHRKGRPHHKSLTVWAEELHTRRNNLSTQVSDLVKKGYLVKTDNGQSKTADLSVNLCRCIEHAMANGYRPSSYCTAESEKKGCKLTSAMLEQPEPEVAEPTEPEPEERPEVAEPTEPEPEERPAVAYIAEDGTLEWQCPDCGTARYADVDEREWRAWPDVDEDYCQSCGATFQIDLRAAKAGL